jgi:hypothetical protein
MIKVAKIAGGFTVHAREPSVRAEWHSLRALTAADLIAELLSRGAGHPEISTALTLADPLWRALL